MNYSLRKAKAGRRFVVRCGRIVRLYPECESSINVLLKVANESPGFWKKVLERQRDFMFKKEAKHDS